MMDELWIVENTLDDYSINITVGRDNAYKKAFEIINKNPNDIKSSTELKESYEKTEDDEFGVSEFLNIRKLTEDEFRLFKANNANKTYTITECSNLNLVIKRVR